MMMMRRVDIGKGVAKVAADCMVLRSQEIGCRHI